MSRVTQPRFGVWALSSWTVEKKVDNGWISPTVEIVKHEDGTFDFVVGGEIAFTGTRSVLIDMTDLCRKAYHSIEVKTEDVIRASIPVHDPDKDGYKWFNPETGELIEDADQQASPPNGTGEAQE